MSQSRCWGGVLKWCNQAAESGYTSLESYPVLSGFDLVIIHADADVASKRYGNCGPAIEELAIRRAWGALPCAVHCPPPLPTVECLERTITGWLGGAIPGKQTVFCIPSKSTGTWLAAACFPSTHRILRDGECDLGLEDRLSTLKRDEKIKKTAAQYRAKASRVTNNWDSVKSLCSSAQRFEAKFLSIIPAK